MDIVFQNGDFFPQDSSFLQDIFTAAIGALIGTGGAIFVYWLQIRREQDKKKAEDHNRSREDMKYFLLILNDSIKFIRSQKNILHDFAESLINKPYATNNINSFPTQPLVRLEKLSHEKIHSIFLSTQENEATNIFHNIYKYADFYSESFKTLSSHVDRDIKEIQNMKIKYIKSFADLIDEVSIKANKIKFGVYNGNPAYKLDRLHALIDAIIFNFYEGREDTTDLEYHQNNFIKPLKEGLILEGHLRDTDCLHIAISSKTTTHLYTDIGFKSKNLGKYIIEYCSAIEENILKFENSITSITLPELKYPRRWYHFLYTPGQ